MFISKLDLVSYFKDRFQIKTKGLAIYIFHKKHGLTICFNEAYLHKWRYFLKVNILTSVRIQIKTTKHNCQDKNNIQFVTNKVKHHVSCKS